MNTPLLCAAVLCALACIVHLFYGGVRIHRPLQQSNASRLARAMASVVWHAATAMMMLNAAALAYAANGGAESGPMVLLIAAQSLAGAALSFFYGISRFGSVFVMPHWVAFLAITMLALWGAGLIPFSA